MVHDVPFRLGNGWIPRIGAIARPLRNMPRGVALVPVSHNGGVVQAAAVAAAAAAVAVTRPFGSVRLSGRGRGLDR